ncbi:MTOR-associated protein MEAK7-like [Mercenaria mercenaria]|uniref:MTOR-associated protein MEAK7-like n=1 Tax=Mercenaria mercenaria TaxID=6596 RepID=UPI00234EE284|nr:MTOR-associated protein MEAK7-like [Mercenaria mercenaria]
MGAGESKKGADILQLFSPEEQQHIHKLFLHIVPNQSITEPFLKKYINNLFDLDSEVFHAICHCRVNEGHIKDKHVTEIQFSGFLAQCLKGTYSEKADIICLLSGRDAGFVPVKKLYQTVHSVVKSYLQISKSDAPCATWKSHATEEDIARLSSSFLSLNKFCEVGRGGEQTSQNEVDVRGGYKSQDEVEDWISKCHMFLKMFDRVFYHLFPVISKDSAHNITQSFMPTASCVDWKKTNTILDTLSISYINYHLPREHQSVWRLLYSNCLHGDSFAQLTRYVLGKGPNVLLVKDKDGYVFGAYVSDSWEIKPSFYGSEDCFLFSLKPEYGVYTVTGYNSNYIYFNQGQETMPNGLGLGGQLNYFGLWIDYTFNSGHSKAVPKCTTYGSPQLSKSPEFVVDSIEVWAVGPEKKKHDLDEDEEEKVSILDKDVGAKAILELAGRKQHSEGIRELEEEEAPMTEEMKKKMNTIPKMM